MKKQILYILLQFAVMLGFGQVYHVGDLYTAEDGSQGIVFFVRADGGGWAVALHDEESSLPWFSTAVDIPALPNPVRREYLCRRHRNGGGRGNS